MANRRACEFADAYERHSEIQAGVRCDINRLRAGEVNDGAGLFLQSMGIEVELSS